MLNVKAESKKQKTKSKFFADFANFAFKALSSLSLVPKVLQVLCVPICRDLGTQLITLRILYLRF